MSSDTLFITQNGDGRRVHDYLTHKFMSEGQDIHGNPRYPHSMRLRNGDRYTVMEERSFTSGNHGASLRGRNSDHIYLDAIFFDLGPANLWVSEIIYPIFSMGDGLKFIGLHNFDTNDHHHVFPRSVELMDDWAPTDGPTPPSPSFSQNWPRAFADPEPRTEENNFEL